MFGLWLTGLLASREIERLTGARSIAGLVLPAFCGYGPRRPGTEVHTDSLGQRTHCGHNVEAPIPGSPTLFGYGFLWAQNSPRVVRLGGGSRPACPQDLGTWGAGKWRWERGELGPERKRVPKRAPVLAPPLCLNQPALTSAQRDLKQEDRAPAGQLSAFFCLNHTLSPMAFPVLG